MKSILLVCLSLAALLVVVLFFFWGTNAHEQAAAASRNAASRNAADGNSAASPAAVSLAPAPASTAADPARQNAVAPGTVDDSGAHSELPLLADLASPEVPPLTVEQDRSAEDQRFEKKYDTVSAPARKVARDAIDQYVRAHKGGAEDNGRKVSEAEITALFHELEWLDAHPAP